MVFYMKYTLIQSFFLLIAFSYLFIGVKISRNSAFELISEKSDSTKFNLSTFLNKSILGLSLGLLSCDCASLAGHERKAFHVNDVGANSLIIWNVLGLYLFALIILSNIYVFLLAIAAITLASAFLDSSLRRYLFALICGLLIVKLGIYGLNFYAHQMIPVLDINLIQMDLIDLSYIALFVLSGMLLSFICFSAVLSTVFIAFLMQMGMLNLFEGVLMLSGIHFGLSLYYVICMKMREKNTVALRKMAIYNFAIAALLAIVFAPFIAHYNYDFVVNWVIIVGLVGAITLLDSAYALSRVKVH